MHWAQSGVGLSAPYTRFSPATTPLTYSSPPGGAIDGACDCTPQPSTSVGTGDVQITLTWHSAQAVDLDLWVTEPSGEICFYGDTLTATGGTLDRDNRCSNYVNGRPENIFWGDAPAGEYVVNVHFFSHCLTGVTSMPFDVRVVTGSSTKTYTGTAAPGDATTVTTFTMGTALTGGPHHTPGGMPLLPAKE